ncbi:TadE/TadG family type IV pilus assembly protein [Phycicoccus avicenniae]|uniref:TadE/TadG family type IV pilus assembly protein n=1 Tax=Phycicoccus avicenniae TaxID=2828860 RepID=UPI003D2B76DB
MGARRDERGAVALEAALTFMFLFFILAGVIDVSIFFKNTFSVSSGARAGARMGSADPLNANFAKVTATQAASAMTDLDWTRITEIWVYKANTATNTLYVPTSCGVVGCVKFTVTAPGTVNAGTGVWTLRNACSGTTIDTVGVLVKYTNKAPVMFANNQVITEDVAMRLEQIPSTQTCVGV